MLPHTKFGIPTSNNVRDMLWTRLFYKIGHRSRSRSHDLKMVHDTPKTPKTHSHTKFGIPTSKNIEDNNYAPKLMMILETQPDVKVTLTQGWYATLYHPKMHLNNKFRIPPSNNIRDMLQTQLFLKLGQRSRSQ